MKVLAKLLVGVILFGFSKNFKLINEVAHVANQAYNGHLVTSVIWWQNDYNDVFVMNFLKQFRGCFVTIAINDDFSFYDVNFHKAVAYRQTVFFVDEVEEFEYFLNIIDDFIIIPIRVILVVTKQISEKSYVHNITKTAWENDVSDIIILTQGSDDDVSIWTYMPYENEICGNYEPFKMNNKSLFNINKFRNFHTCPIRLTALHHLPYTSLTIENGTVTSINGYDGRVLKLLLSALNATVNIVSATDHGDIGSVMNGSAYGSFADLVNNVADLMIPASVINSNKYSAAQISPFQYSLTAVWCGPPQREIYQWAKVLLPFANLYTPILILSCLVLLIIIKIARKFGRVKDKFQGGEPFKMFVLFIGQVAELNSRYWLINSLFVIWIWFCMIVRITYQGSLMDGLHMTILEPPLGSLEEAIRKVDGVGGRQVFLEFYKNTSIERKYQFINLTEIPQRIKEIAMGKNFLLAVDAVHISFYKQKGVQVLDELVSNTLTCLHMRPRWPAAPNIARLISRLTDTGLLDKIQKQYKFEWALLQRNASSGDNIKPIEIATLSSCFYGLALMYIVCILILLGEIIWHKYKVERRAV